MINENIYQILKDCYYSALSNLELCPILDSVPSWAIITYISIIFNFYIFIYMFKVIKPLKILGTKCFSLEVSQLLDVKIFSTVSDFQQL